MQTPLFGPGGPASAPAHPTAIHPAKSASLRVGLPAGVTAAERRAWNSAALTLTRLLYTEKRYPDAGEKQILARYSGQGAVGASLGEYYTPPELAETLWQMLGKLGFEQGVALDPACGTGVLLQHAPAEVSAVGVERSEKSGRIARLLRTYAGD